MKRTSIAERNSLITVPGERVVVAGGTQGIGAGIACRFAMAGAEVWIIGRNETKANEVLARMNQISQEKKLEPAPKHCFIKADLSLIAETKRTAEEIHARAGVRGVDYLVLCQGGPPNGSYVLTPEGLEQHYAVQVLSRFILAHTLALNPNSVVKKSVLSVMAPGYRYPAVDFADLDMREANQKGTYGIRACIARDSVCIDTVTEEMARRAPSIAFTHVFPGHVQTDFARNSAVPWFLSLLARVFLAIAGDTPASYAEVPFFLMVHPEGRDATLKANGKFWDENAEAMKVAGVEEQMRTKVWEHMMEQMSRA